MSVLNFRVKFPGQAESNLPRIGKMLSSDTLSTCTSAGYLDAYIQSSGLTLTKNDVLLVVASNGTQFYKPVFSANGSCQLTALP